MSHAKGEDTTGGEDPPVVIRDKRKVDLHGGKLPPPAEAAEEAIATSEAKIQLAERTADLQRLQAEYANYRKRVDRDRVLVGEVATARVLVALVPVLDDIERADAHGDVTGPFRSVADKLTAALDKLGLAPFGAEGEPFDPSQHEAVMHDERDDIAVPTTTTIMRRGYRVGDRLLRPAMVGVSDPATQADPS